MFVVDFIGQTNNNHCFPLLTEAPSWLSTGGRSKSRKWQLQGINLRAFLRKVGANSITYLSSCSCLLDDLSYVTHDCLQNLRNQSRWRSTVEVTSSWQITDLDLRSSSSTTRRSVPWTNPNVEPACSCLIRMLHAALRSITSSCYEHSGLMKLRLSIPETRVNGWCLWASAVVVPGSSIWSLKWRSDLKTKLLSPMRDCRCANNNRIEPFDHSISRIDDFQLPVYLHVPFTRVMFICDISGLLCKVFDKSGKFLRELHLPSNTDGHTSSPAHHPHRYEECFGLNASIMNLIYFEQAWIIFIHSKNSSALTYLIVLTRDVTSLMTLISYHPLTDFSSIIIQIP